MVEGMAGAISVRGLRKSYGSITAVDDVSFDVEPGEFFGILGPNGAGKTTTLEMIEGLPAREQIRTFASLYGVGARRADQMLDTVGLSDSGEVRTEKLSGGQAQRLSIACALVHDPELVFMDEPTGSLDPQARRNLWDLLRHINAEGRTVVLTTHHMDEAETLCDRVAIMDHGQILKLGPPAALVRGLDSPVRISVESGKLTAAEAGRLGDGNGAANAVTDDGVSLTIATRDPAAVLAGLAGKSALAGLRVQDATLEDVFLDLTGREYRA